MNIYTGIGKLMCVLTVSMLSGCFDHSSEHSQAPVVERTITHNQTNKHHDKVVRHDPLRTLLDVAGLGQIHDSTTQIMQRYLKPVVVNFRQGTISDKPDAINQFRRKRDARQLATIALPEGTTFAGMNSRPVEALVYLIKQKDGVVNQVVFPIEGHSYSQIKGYLVLDSHHWHIKKIAFYEQGETPSLGGRIMTDQNWLAQFNDKQVFKADKTAFKVVINHAEQLDSYSVDGLSGATHTSQTVEAVINDWMGPEGYGSVLPLLTTLSEK